MVGECECLASSSSFLYDLLLELLEGSRAKQGDDEIQQFLQSLSTPANTRAIEIVSFNQRNKHHSSCQARAIDLNSRAAKRLPYSPYSMAVAFSRKQNLMRQPQQSDYIPSILRIRRSYIENWFGCSSRIPNSANTRNGIHGTSSAKCLYQLNFLFISKSSSDAPSSFLCFLFRRVFFLLLFCRNVNKIIRFIFISTTSWRHYKGRKAVAEIYVSRFAFCHHQGRRYLLCYNVWNWKKKLWFPKVLAAIVNALCLALICRR